MASNVDIQGSLLERFRTHLAVMARLHLEPALQGKVDLSGVVQQTLIEAHQAIRQLERMSPAQQHGWLRRAMSNNLVDELRRLGSAMRNVGREQSLDVGLEESSARLAAWVASDDPTPSAQAIQNEQLIRLTEVLPRLPDDQRRAVELHHLQGFPVAEVAKLMGRSEGATGALLVRALRRLRELLHAKE